MEEKKVIVISGATGFIGSALSAFLEGHGFKVCPLRRMHFEERNRGLLNDIVKNCSIVINLAGATINHRWAKSYKQEMRQSRLNVTERLVEAVNSSSSIQLFISASASGFYDSNGCHDEFTFRKGSGFLAELCQEWEAEVDALRPDLRRIIMRFGVVLASRGGAFPQMNRLASLGLAPVLGCGKQAFPWIDLLDLCRAVLFLIQMPEISGPVNMVAPQQINQKQFIQTVAGYKHVYLTLPVPAFLIKLIWGEAATFLLKGQCVKPVVLERYGFKFISSDVIKFLSTL